MSPRSHSCITATAVNVFVIEAIRNTVALVIGSFDATSAIP